MPYGLASQATELLNYRTKIEKKVSSLLTKPEPAVDLVYRPFTKGQPHPSTPLNTSKLHQLSYPIELINSFIKLADANTRHGIETCGVLCGIKRDSYYVTNIFVPMQKGNEDMCVATDYEEIEQYVNKNKLLVLGWIHTHPKFTCFLSSVDLHTQYGYQRLLPESVAIVYSGLSLPKSEK
eukprot:TRINITY_DN9958_c0_g1_i4.p2 TRINITY_DN9958_c0_g1~~TRINITY_DN9958_c0_g1_i4.p2  ORF type:complete len:180 (-),score=30.00 TRINITY_DN9958_c0_g1_i4:348-887(-)